MKAKTTKKPVELTDEEKAELQSIKIYKSVHKELKRHLIDNEGGLTEFASIAILEKLAK